MEFNHSLVGYFFSRFLLVGLFSLLVQKKEKPFFFVLPSITKKNFSFVLILIFNHTAQHIGLPTLPHAGPFDPRACKVLHKVSETHPVCSKVPLIFTSSPSLFKQRC
jgi:hypothetical protein